MEQVEVARMRLEDKSSRAKRLKITQLLLSAATHSVKACPERRRPPQHLTSTSSICLIVLAGGGGVLGPKGFVTCKLSLSSFQRDLALLQWDNDLRCSQPAARNISRNDPQTY